MPVPVPPSSAEPTREPFLAEPIGERVVRNVRQVRSTEVTPDGRLRFDALARCLQDVAEDDVTEADFPDPPVWILRRSAVSVRRYPRCGEWVELRTFCSATGPRWAERTTTVVAVPPGLAGGDTVAAATAGTGDATGDGALLQTRAVWVAVDPDSGQPMPLSAAFHKVFGPSAQGRRVSARLVHPGPPAAAGAGDAARRPWPLRTSDFDIAGHVNNAIHWAAVEDVIAAAGWLPTTAEVEYHHPVLAGCRPTLVVDGSAEPADRRLGAWLLDGDRRLASALLTGSA